MPRIQKKSTGRWLVVSLYLVALGATALAVDAEEEEAREKPRPEKSYEVLDVQLVAGRADGPPAVVLITREGKLQPEAGTYRTRDGKALHINKGGQILQLSDPEAGIKRFEVAKIDKVAVRQDDAPDHLVLTDARERSAALPDGRFVNEEEAMLVVRRGMIVAITPSTPDPFNGG